jgi:hypothetical protein
MSWFEKSAGWLVAGCLLAVLILSHTCKGPSGGANNQSADTVITTRIDTLRDTLHTTTKRIDTIKQYRTYLRRDTIRDTILQSASIDTQAVLKAYFTKKAITRTWQDSNIQASLTDTIAKNRLMGSTGLDYQFTEKTTTKRIRTAKTYLGGGLGAGKRGLSYSLKAIHTRPGGPAYSLSYSPALNTLQAGIYVKIPDKIPLIP